MTVTTITLNQLTPGQSARIKKIMGKGPIRRRLFDMGLTGGTEITVVKTSPLGDPVDYLVRGYHLSLRKSEAEMVVVHNA
ncbi:MAG: FeoA family protein [Chloroflexota bacterium]